MIDGPESWPAWLEDGEGKRTPIRGSCSLGRSESNQITLRDDTVSRRHAVIQPQGEHEYWLVDFGSSNGTYVTLGHDPEIRLLREELILHGTGIISFGQSASAPEAEIVEFHCS